MRGFSIRPFCSSILLIAGLAIAGCMAAPAADSAKPSATGPEILWDRYGVPHIFAPDHPSLFQAYGYAQMEAHSELLIRLYAQARGRGAEFFGPQYLDSDRWVRTNGLPDTAKKWAAGQSPEFAPLIEAFYEGPERMGQRAPGGPQPRSPGRAAAHRGGCLRAWPARDSLRLDREPAAARGPARPLRRRGARLQRMGHRPRPLGHRQGHPDEQFAPAMGRHPHLLRGPAHRARGHVVWRRMGRLSSAAPVLHGVRRLDADHEQPIRVRSLQAGAEGRRLRARRPGEGVRHAHRDHQGARGQRPDEGRAAHRAA